MSTNTPTPAEDVAAWHDLEAKRLAIVEQQDAIKARLRDTLGHGKHDTPAGTVSVSPNRRWNEDLARTVVNAYNPALLVEALTERVVVELDRDLLKKQLPPATYAACMKETGSDRVAIS